MTNPPPGPPLLVFADDWGRHPSGCQHLIRCLLDRYSVWWVNTIGTRRPGLDAATFRRGLGKLAQWVGLSPPAAPPPPNLHVHNPVMWPWCTTAFDRRVNRRLLLRYLAPLLKTLPEPPIAISKVPVSADLMGELPVRRWVYYCVDDIAQWPGLDQPAMQLMEDQAVQRCDILLTTSEVLQSKLRRLGREAILLTHGVDCSFWQNGVDHGPPVPGLDRLERPLVVFWGVLDRRMDVDVVRRLCSDLRRGTVAFVGPRNNPDPALFRLPRTACLPAVRFTQLPELAREASVLIMPYADRSVTRACQPLKLKEYLATCKPTVVRDLPATRSWADCMDLANTPESFSAAVRLRLETGLPDEQRHARARLEGESWAEKARQFEALALQGELGPAPVVVGTPSAEIGLRTSDT